MKDMKVTHKPNVFLLSDSLASVDDVCTMTHGGKTIDHAQLDVRHPPGRQVAREGDGRGRLG